jgi:hypothetical protein
MQSRRGNTRGNASIAALVLVVVLASPACAQSPPSAVPTDASPQTPTPPVPVVNCDSYLPPGFKIPQDAIATRVSYRLAVDRTVHDLAVYRSSGNADLDKAALQCAGTALGWAAIQDANPTEIKWIRAIYWKIAQHILLDANPFSESPNICHGGYPVIAVRRCSMSSIFILKMC